MPFVPSPRPGPVVLAVDASSSWCSAALLHGDAVDLLAEDAGHGHSRRLLPMVDQLLARRGLRVADCDAIAFGAGPGAFTGLRIACGVAQGLAFGAGRPVVPVDCVAATAVHARRLVGAAPERPVIVALDARMGEVYHAWVEDARPGVPVARLAAPEAAAAHLLAALEARAAAGPVPLAAGDGFARHADALASITRRVGAALPQAHARADAVARLAAEALAAGATLAAADAAPLYVRDKVALDVDEQRALRAARAGAAAERAT